MGTVTPAAVALLVPIGMSFACTYRISPLMVGMMVICGAHAGAFSPMAVSGALAFHLQIGFLALAAGAVLALLDRENLGRAVEGISWPTILLVAGMVTYVGVPEHSGTIDWVAHGAAGPGAPLLVALVLCVIVGVTSAFASSTAILTATIPMVIPLLRHRRPRADRGVGGARPAGLVLTL